MWHKQNKGLKEEQQKNANLAEEIAQTQVQVQNAAESQAALEAEKNQLYEELERLKSSREADVSQKTKQLEELMKEHEELRKTQLELRSTHENVKRELDAEVDSRKRAEAQLAESEKDKASLSGVFRNLQEVHTNQKAELEIVRNQQAEDQKKLSELRAAKDMANAELSRMKGTADTSKGSFDAQLARERSEFSFERQKMEKEVSTAQARIKQLEDELAAEKKAHAARCAEHDEDRKQWTFAREAHEFARQAHESLQKDHQAQMQTISDLKAKQSGFATDASKVTKDHEALKRVHAAVVGEKETVECFLKTTKDAHEDLLRKHEALKEQVSAMTRANEKFGWENEQLKKDAAVTTTAVETVQESMRQEIRSAREAQFQAEQQRDEALAKMRCAQAEKQALEDHVGGSAIKFQSLRQELEAERRAKDLMSWEHDKTNRELTALAKAYEVHHLPVNPRRHMPGVGDFSPGSPVSPMLDVIKDRDPMGTPRGGYTKGPHSQMMIGRIGQMVLNG